MNGEHSSTHPNRIMHRLDSPSSPMVSTATLRLFNRTRTGCIFPTIPGDIYGCVNRYLKMHACYYTLWSCRNLSNEDFNQPAVSRPRGEDDSEETYSQLCNLIVYRLLLGHLPPHTLTLPKPCNPGAYLIDEDCLSEFLDEPDDHLRISRLVENPCRLPFPQQCLRSLFDLIKGPADDYFRMAR